MAPSRLPTAACSSFLSPLPLLEPKARLSCSSCSIRQCTTSSTCTSSSSSSGAPPHSVRHHHVPYISHIRLPVLTKQRHNSSPRLRTHGTNTSHTLVHGLFKWTLLSTTQPFRPTCPLRTLCTPRPHLPLARCNSTHWVSHWRRPLGQHGLVLTPRA